MNDPENETRPKESLSSEPMQEGSTPPAAPRARRALLQLPGLIAIGLYMIVLAAIDVLSVMSHQLRPVFLVLAVLWIASGLGLLMLLRWAWAVTAATLALLSALLFWRYASSHQSPFAVQGLMNLIVFFYLVRATVREKLR